MEICCCQHRETSFFGGSLRQQSQLPNLMSSSGPQGSGRTGFIRKFPTHVYISPKKGKKKHTSSHDGQHTHIKSSTCGSAGMAFSPLQPGCKLTSRKMKAKAAMARKGFHQERRFAGKRKADRSWV